jgi:hypothetical protein
MGRIAYDLADHVVVTSDNPRTEDPEQILQDIVAGIPAVACRGSGVRSGGGHSTGHCHGGNRGMAC